MVIFVSLSDSFCPSNSRLPRDGKSATRPIDKGNRMGMERNGNKELDSLPPPTGTAEKYEEYHFGKGVIVHPSNWTYFIPDASCHLTQKGKIIHPLVA
jgi:hypothetical protein